MAKTIVGTVTSIAGSKSIIVSTKTSKRHPIYRKSQTRTAKFMAHDEKNQAVLGDLVEIAEIAPLSARKRFGLSKVITKSNVHYEAADATADVDEHILGSKTDDEVVES